MKPLIAPSRNIRAKLQDWFCNVTAVAVVVLAAYFHVHPPAGVIDPPDFIQR